MSKTVCVTLSQFCESDIRPRQILEQAGFCVRENKTGLRLKVEELHDFLKDADAVLAAVEPYNQGLLDKLPKLRCISRCGVGVENIDLNAAKGKNIAVLNTPNEIVAPVAEITIAMIMALAKNFTLHLSDAHEGLWKKHTGRMLSEWTIGIVGFGRIGRAVAGLLSGFGVKPLVFDPNIDASHVSDYVELCGFDDLLARSDLISLHVSRSSEYGPLLSKVEFGKMKKGAFVVNTARGYLLDENALQDVLESGHLAGCALDVYYKEPYSGPLLKLPNVLCTPHIATLTRASRAAMELRCAQNVVEFFNDK